MKVFLALAFVAVAAALPQPISLPEPVLPQVAEQNDVVDAVKFVDSPLSYVAPQAPEDVAPQAEEIQVDAVRFVDAAQPEVAGTNAVKVADFPVEALVQPEETVAADNPADAVKFVDAPLEVLDAEIAPVAEEIQADPVQFVDAPLEEVAPQAEEIKVDAIKIVDAPIQEEVEVAREPEFVVPTPVVLPSPALPVVQPEIQYGVQFVDTPQGTILSPVFFEPNMPLIDFSPMIVPQQILDQILAAEQAQLDAVVQGLPRPAIIIADPLLR